MASSQSARRKLLLLLIAVPFGLAMLVIGAKWKRAYDYPFGFSHSCDKQLYMLLREYADAHGGVFPTGKSTPEASLSLVASGKDPTHFELLRGKTIPASIVVAQLRAAGELTPQTCGWNYVEGLTKDDGDCALFWDKDGLGHNGERLAGGGYMVTFANSNQKHIPADKWSQFLAEQSKLRAAASANRVDQGLP